MIIPTLKCPHCRRLMRFTYDETTRLHYRQCDYHGSVRVRCIAESNIEDVKIIKTIFVVLYKEERYDVSFSYTEAFPKFVISKVKRVLQNSKIVMTLDFHPDLTPENVEQKLPMMILFS